MHWYHALVFLPNIDIHAEDKKGKTLLAVACNFKKREHVKFLLSIGADPNLTGTKENQTPLMIACQNGNKDIAQALIDNGADVNAKCRYYRRTALHYACLRKDLKFQENKKAAIHREYMKMRNGQTQSRSQCVKLLLKHGAVYCADSYNLTPLCYAGLSRMDEEVWPTFAKANLDSAFSNVEKIRTLQLRGNVLCHLRSQGNRSCI